MLQLLVWQVTKGNAFVFGGDWRIPVKHDLLNPDFVEELKEDGTYNELSFSREYDSIWSGSSEDAFFDGDLIDRHRNLENPEFEPDTKSKNVEYIISADVARMVGKQNADTAALVIKIRKRKNGTQTKSVVNMYIFNGEHFESQAIRLKKLFFHYNARQLIVDANGLGVGLVDYLVKKNEDGAEIFPPFSITNDEEGKYNQFKTPDSIPALFNIKANSSNSSDIHVNCLSQISSGKVKFLIDAMTAKQKILNSKEGLKLKDSSVEFAKRMAPHVTTDLLKDEMLNLTRKTEGKNIQLERVNKKIQKDKFSALEYGLWWCKLQEDKLVKRRDDVDSSKFLLIRQPSWGGNKKSKGWR